MLTPRFTCRQDDEFVYIDITVSHIRFDAPGVQIEVEQELLVFSLSPYYLRLRFDKPLIDDEERSTAKYESKTETINVKIPKLNKGDVFEDLDLPAKLMARTGETDQSIGQAPQVLDSKQLLQEIGINSADEGMIREAGKIIQEEEVKQTLGEAKHKPLIEDLSEKTDLEATAQEAEQFNWEINQTFDDDTTLKISYGFDNKYDSIVGVSITNGNDINELDDPEHTSANDRIKERLLKENFKFDPEYYAADYMTAKYSEEDEYSPVKDLLKYENPLCTAETIEFTEKENELMLDLPNKAYLITNPKPLYYTIISLLFAYSFEMRQTEGEFTTESAWTVGKLTPQISCLDSQVILPDVTIPMVKALIITGVRRALSYPLNRNYSLAIKAWNDVVLLLKQGQRAVIKALLGTREPFRFHDVYYAYNKVLLEDLVNWLVKDTRDNDFILKSLSLEVEKQLGSLKKDEIVFEQLDDEGDVDTSLSIAEIESLAEQMYAEQQQ